MVLIFGKDSCPYTQAARDHYKENGAAVEYINVKKDAAGLQRMLEFSGGPRRGPGRGRTAADAGVQGRPARGAGRRRERKGDDRFRRNLRRLIGARGAPIVPAARGYCRG